jgi:hypothetical protein
VVFSAVISDSKDLAVSNLHPGKCSRTFKMIEEAEDGVADSFVTI